MFRRSLLYGTAAFALLIGPLLPTASAGQINTAPSHQAATSGALGFGGSIGQSNIHSGGKVSGPLSNNPYNVSSALAAAISVGSPSDTASLSTNLGDPGNGGILSGKKGKGPILQLNSAPTVQTAVGTAVSIGGNASAAALNSDDIGQSSLHH